MEALKQARFRAPAKLNLFLHITGRRADGFHDLQTVFQLVDLCDEVTIAVREDGRIVREPPPRGMLAGLAEGDDLTVRAARLLQAHVRQAGDTAEPQRDVIDRDDRVGHRGDDRTLRSGAHWISPEIGALIASAVPTPASASQARATCAATARCLAAGKSS